MNLTPNPWAAACRSLLVGLAALPCQLPEAAAAEPAPEAPRCEAQRWYEISHWRRAFDAYAVRADGGDADAARVCLMMVRYGRALYNEDFKASPDKISAWRATAVRGWQGAPPAAATCD